MNTINYHLHLKSKKKKKKDKFNDDLTIILTIKTTSFCFPLNNNRDKS